MANKIDLSGRIAVVTGGAVASSGISERLVASGAKVAIWDRDPWLARRLPMRLAAAPRR